VLPTGAGKTDTVVDWTLDLMAAEDHPRLRVLWIAHQQELLDQAAGRYRASALRCEPGFKRNLRVVHGDASPPSALGGKDVDIVLATVQSLRLRHDTAKRKLLETFLSRPTIVVVDEAHHAGAPGYDRVLDELEQQKNLVALIGLTATPRPTSASARVKVRERFGQKPLIKVQKETLIKDLILARPRLNTVETKQVILVTAREARRALRDDFSPEFMRQLANDERDELVVSTWLRDREKWGRTLAFATSIDHAESMREAFRARGVDADALHSEVGDGRAAILKWFRDTEDAVLVSVGMLTEGVDLPAARTAFLARPTASHILLEQMQGRVLRGPRAGGDREAYIVYFHDLWRNFPNVADPREDAEDADDQAFALLRKRSLHRVPIDVIAELEALFGQTSTSEGGVSDPSAGDTEEDEDEYPYEVPDPRLIESRLVGYYDLGEDQRSVPVLAHYAEGLAEMIAAKLDPRRRRMPPLMSFFDDVHAPLPSDRAINALLDYVYEFQEAPPLVSVDAAVGPSVAASEIYRLGDEATEGQVRDIVRQHWESISGVSSPSLASFEDPVRAELDELRAHGGARHGVEAPLRPPAKPDLKPIPRVATRDLKGLLLRVVRTAQEQGLLTPSLLERLGESDVDLPSIDWTRKPESAAFGWWRLELRKPEKRGEQTIRINRVLMGPREAISDELLEFLIWHELLHHLLPGQQHRPPFREFESRWPNAPALDDEIDRLHEKWDLPPKSYS
jgi:superfamily II DNA or RNA helicase